MDMSADGQFGCEPLDHIQPPLRGAKAAYTTRFVSRLLAADARSYHLLADTSVRPRPGDVVLARVEAIGQHKRLELPDGRRGTLFVGDDVLVAYGNRYAPDQFEAEVPADLGPVHLVAAGGVAARVVSAHEAMEEATLLRPIGLLADVGGVVSLRRCAPLRPSDPVTTNVARGSAIAVLGTSMNAGKTTTAAALIRGIRAAGLRVAAGKVTGTGAGGDTFLFTDSGACAVLDFTDFGYASTYLLDHQEVRRVFASILDELAASHPDVVVIEVADGLLQRETARLIADPIFGKRIDATVFAAGDALGAQAGCSLLSARGLPTLALSGRLTASPLATREARAALDLPVLTVEELATAASADLLPARTRSVGADALAAN